MTLNIFQNPRHIFGEPEEITFFGISHQRPAADGGFKFVRLRLGFRDEFFLPFVIPTFVTSLINIIIGDKSADDFPHRRLMAILSRADEIIVGDPDLFPKTREAQDHLISKLGRWNFALLRRLDHLDAVFIRAGEKKSFVAAKTVIPGHDIGGDGCINMPQMRLAVGVVNRSRDVKSPGHESHLTDLQQKVNTWGQCLGK